MRISFDIDDTLVLHGRDAQPEVGHFPPFIQRHFGQPLRSGTCALMRELRLQGHSIWIYTTSGRTPFEIRFWLFMHGIHIDVVVNDERHRREVTGHKFAQLPSKYPPAFGIDLHVDDSDGVLMEGQEHRFRVVVVSPDDEHWTKKVLDAVNE